MDGSRRLTEYLATITAFSESGDNLSTWIPADLWEGDAAIGLNFELARKIGLAPDRELHFVARPKRALGATYLARSNGLRTCVRRRYHADQQRGGEARELPTRLFTQASCAAIRACNSKLHA